MSSAGKKPPEKAGDDPARLGFLALMRRLERKSPDRPRIGRNRTLREAVAAIGQDPFLAFPEADLSAYDAATNKLCPSVRARFLGFFGPQGALPVNTTEEVLRWFELGDDAFVRFTDIFAARFLELYFRAWSDARAISQFDHPEDDRFSIYASALAGIATPSFRRRDQIDDIVKLPMVGLHAARVKSPVRLRQMLVLHLDADIEVEEHVPSWMEFEPESQSRIGQRGSTLGRDLHVGSRMQTVNERIKLHIRASSLERYRRFLPSGPDYAALQDIVFWYLGRTIEVEVALSLPATEVAPAVIGKSTELGWMAAVSPTEGGPEEFVEASRFDLDAARAV